MIYPMKMKAPLKDYLWGGTRLKEEYGKETTSPIVAESWELSVHPDGLSTIESGEAAGTTLADWLDAHEGALGERAHGKRELPILIKLIDAKGNLSVQVHPDDAYARRVEGESGKTELWYVVDAEPGASLYWGFAREVTSDEVRRRIDAGTLLEVLNKVPVKKGDVFFIPAGTIHAIGAGILIAEIQQSANTTYRVYDYGRVDKKTGRQRELHIEKALDVLRLTPPSRDAIIDVETEMFFGARARLLASSDIFTVTELEVRDTCALFAGLESFHSFTVLTGALTLEGGGEILSLSPGDTVFVPAGLGRYNLLGAATILLTTL